MSEPCKEAKELAEEILPNRGWKQEYYEQTIKNPLAQKIQAVIDKAKEDK